MHLSMSSRQEGKRGIGRDFDRSLWPGGRAFEFSCCPGGRDIWIFVRARDQKSFLGVGNLVIFDLTFLPGGRQFHINLLENVKIPLYARLPPLPPCRLDIDRCISLCLNLSHKLKRDQLPAMEEPGRNPLPRARLFFGLVKSSVVWPSEDNHYTFSIFTNFSSVNIRSSWYRERSRYAAEIHFMHRKPNGLPMNKMKKIKR